MLLSSILWPLADLLIGSLAEADPGLDVAHIPHRDPSDLVGLAEVHHLARRLMQEVTLLAVALRAHLGVALEQALGPARTGLTTMQFLLQHAVDLVAPVFAGAQLSSRDDERVPFARRHRGHMDLPQIHSRDGSCRQWRGQGVSRLQRQAELVVIRPPGQFGPTQMDLTILLWQWQQQRRALPSHGQAEHSVGQDLQRLILPDHRLVAFGMVGRGGLDVSGFRHLLPSQFGGGRHIGGGFLAERLHTLAVQGILPTFGRRLELPCAQPPPLQMGLSMEGEQVGPHASGLGAQRLALSQCGGGETPQGHEPHEALGGRLLVGHRSPPCRPQQENTGEHRRTQENTAYSLEQMFVKQRGRFIPAMNDGAFSLCFCKR
jgi:hypothetical protein